MLGAMYIVQDGVVDAMHGTRRFASFTSGDHWGDAALQLEIASDATYKARTTATVLTLSRADLEAKLGPFAVRKSVV